MKNKIYYRLGMICNCGSQDHSHMMDEAYKILSQPKDEDFLTVATHFVNSFDCYIKLVSDMWCGVDIIYVEDVANETAPKKTWQETYRFRAECDRVEDGIAAAVVHLHQMHTTFKPDGWYAKVAQPNAHP